MLIEVAAAIEITITARPPGSAPRRPRAAAPCRCPRRRPPPRTAARVGRPSASSPTRARSPAAPPRRLRSASATVSASTSRRRLGASSSWSSEAGLSSVEGASLTGQLVAERLLVLAPLVRLERAPRSSACSDGSSAVSELLRRAARRTRAPPVFGLRPRLPPSSSTLPAELAIAGPRLDRVVGLGLGPAPRPPRARASRSGRVAAGSAGGRPRSRGAVPRARPRRRPRAAVRVPALVVAHPGSPSAAAAARCWGNPVAKSTIAWR